MRKRINRMPVMAALTLGVLSAVLTGCSNQGGANTPSGIAPVPEARQWATAGEIIAGLNTRTLDFVHIGNNQPGLASPAFNNLSAEQATDVRSAFPPNGCRYILEEIPSAIDKGQTSGIPGTSGQVNVFEVRVDTRLQCASGSQPRTITVVFVADAGAWVPTTLRLHPTEK